MVSRILAGLAALFFLTGSARGTASLFEAKIKIELSQRHPSARVELTGSPQWLSASPTGAIQKVEIMSENSLGQAQFLVETDKGQAFEGLVPFAAWIPSRIALRRIHPGEKLTPDLFVTQDVDAASGPAYEYRGVILPSDTEVRGLEAKQTILEGQFLVSTAVQRIPDVRRGDVVRIHLVSGDLVVSTLGTAQEAAYLNTQVRVISSTTKRELVGMLQPGAVVEVKL